MFLANINPTRLAVIAAFIVVIGDVLALVAAVAALNEEQDSAPSS